MGLAGRGGGPCATAGRIFSARFESSRVLNGFVLLFCCFVRVFVAGGAAWQPLQAVRIVATLGTIEGYAVGGCCDLSTSTHHLVQRLGVEQGYNLAKETGRDLEEGIACATAGLRRRFAARVWRDYYKHVDARRRYANPTDEGLAAQQRDRQIEEESRRRENEERVAQYNYFAARASNRSAWARAGMG